MRRRRGFTLVELLVAMALVVFIMAILSQAFVAATRSFSDLKALGDTAEKLRAARGVLQRDLAADHFEGKKRLSSATFWTLGPPQSGFFRVWQGSRPSTTNPNAPYFIEGTDPQGLASHRAVDHMLHFTVKLRGNGAGDLFAAGVPAGSPLLSPLLTPPGYSEPGKYNAQWAEVVYFLRPSIDPKTGDQDTAGSDNTPAANRTPLYSLYRRQLLLVTDNALVQPAVADTPANRAAYVELSTTQDYNNPGFLYFNSPADVTSPARRFGMVRTPGPTAGLPEYNDPLTGRRTYRRLAEEPGVPSDLRASDLLLTDVISFEVRLLLLNTTDTANISDYNNPDQVNPFVDLYHSFGIANFGGLTEAFNLTKFASPLFQLDGPRAFDTWSQDASPAPGSLPDYTTWRLFNNPLTNMPMMRFNVSSDMGNGLGPIVRALQITIRVWEPKTQQTRQVTLVQSL